MKLADTQVLGTCAARLAGSSPVPGTTETLMAVVTETEQAIVERRSRIGVPTVEELIAEEIMNTGVASRKDLDVTTRYSLVKPIFERIKAINGNAWNIVDEYGIAQIVQLFHFEQAFGPDVVGHLIKDGLIDTYASDTNKSQRAYIDMAISQGWKQVP